MCDYFRETHLVFEWVMMRNSRLVKNSLKYISNCVHIIKINFNLYSKIQLVLFVPLVFSNENYLNCLIRQSLTFFLQLLYIYTESTVLKLTFRGLESWQIVYRAIFNPEQSSAKGEQTF